MLTIALPKGRLADQTLDIMEKAGYDVSAARDKSRKLILEDKDAGLRFILSKPSDVPTYVEYGAADIGVVGKDTLLEEGRQLYEVLDLGLGKCRMCVAAKKGFRDNSEKTIKVATMFVNIAKGHYASKGRDIEICKLNGSIEIAPILGMTDVIVDIVETGTTLKENDLEVIETIIPISARLVANKASSKFKSQQINDIRRKLQEVIDND